jgi:hypothetical protein
MAAEFALNGNLREAFEDLENIDLNRVKSLLDESKNQGVTLDGTTLGFSLKKAIKRLSDRLLEDQNNLELMKRLETAAGFAHDLPFDVNTWRSQNNYYQMLQTTYPEKLDQALKGDAAAREWVEHFAALGRNLSVKIDVPSMPELQLAS